jgi:hypothetical protein
MNNATTLLPSELVQGRHLAAKERREHKDVGKTAATSSVSFSRSLCSFAADPSPWQLKVI